MEVQVSLIALFFVVGILMVLRHIFHKNGGRITFQAGHSASCVQ